MGFNYGGGGFSGGAVSSVLTIPDGTVNAPGLAFTSNGANTGWYLLSSERPALSRNGTLVLHSDVNGRIQVDGLVLDQSSSDVLLVRDAAASLQFGVDVNGAPVAQTIKSHDGITGTDIAGANLTVAGGRGTGAGAGGNLILQVAPALATGTTAQTLSDRVVVVGKAKALTESSATTFVTIGVASGGMVGGTITYAIRGSDGTDHTCRAGVLPFAIVNKADAEVGTVGTVGTATEVVAVTAAATLTNTFTIVTGSNAMAIQANAACSLTQTTLEISYTVTLCGPGTVTPA